VDIFEDDDRRGGPPKLAGKRSDQIAGGNPGIHGCRELPAELIADVDERTQRAGSEQRLARATEDTDLESVTEGVDNRGLADSCLAGKQNHAPVPGSGNSVQLGTEHGELLGPLQ
jgi:hypothetical protein